MTQVILFLLVMAIIIPIGLFMLGERKEKRFKSMLGVNIVSFFGVMIIGTVLLFTDVQAAETVTAAGSAGISTGLAYIAAALSTGFSCIGAGIAVSSAASAALGALSENEGIMGKAMIFVALAEGVAIYGLIISIMILGQVG